VDYLEDPATTRSSSLPRHLRTKLAKNFHANFNLLLKLQSLRQPVLAKEKTMTAAA